VPYLSSTYYRPYHLDPPTHMYLKPFKGTDTNPFVIASETARSRLGGVPIDVYYRDLDSNIADKPPDNVELIMRRGMPTLSDFHEGTTVSPLLYEGYHVPAGVYTPNECFIVTHVRGDKRRQDVKITKTKTMSYLLTGTVLMTEFVKNDGPPSFKVAFDVLHKFFFTYGPN